jgi:hypothetical protein
MGKKKYQKPMKLNEYKEKDFVTKELPFVGATSVYKTYIPLSKSLQL